MVNQVKAIIRPIVWFLINWRYHVLCAYAWASNRLAAGRYHALDVETVYGRKKSDTIFVFGSGYSVNDITSEQWAVICQHDTLGFNWFMRQDFIPLDYHLGRELHRPRLGRRASRAIIAEYADLLEKSVHQATTLILQGGWSAAGMNMVVGSRRLTRGRALYRFRNTPPPGPSHSLQRGLVHQLGTLSDAVNFAYLGGWRHIVLVGVDLYDHRYFWLPPDELREDYAKHIMYTLQEKGPDQTTRTVKRRPRLDDVHSTARNGIVDLMADWDARMPHSTLWVLNPRSLLAEVLPAYEIETDE